jgi:cellulose synthase/poly-beta-1,6-N-acetylglucosamine synthase-like glycosyltransferase
MLIKFQGSGALIRKKALVEVGGWDEDLLAEDIALSYLLQLHHWKILFLPEVVVSCQLPNNLKDYTAQQFKWIRGLMETFLKISGKIISSSLPILKKIEALLQLGRRGIYAFWGALFVVYLFWALVFPSSQFFSIFPLLLISLFLLYLTFALAIAFSNWIFGERLPAALFWGLSIWILFFLTTVTDFLATLEAVLGRQTKAWPRVKKFYLKRG